MKYFQEHPGAPQNQEHLPKIPEHPQENQEHLPNDPEQHKISHYPKN